MLPFTTYGKDGPLVVMLHWLGGSAKTWTELGEGLSERGMTPVALDLPGFGRAVDMPDTSIDATAHAVIETIRTLRNDSEEPWFLAGHSMGGKLTAIVARASLDCVPGLSNLSGLILISPSPPSSEPMEESTRHKMLDSLGESTQDPDKDRERADAFVDDNTGKLPLADAVRTRTVDDVLRMNRAAFTAWLTTGSKEDWSERVGNIPIPTVILAGTEEPALGPDAQKKHTQSHFSHSTLIPLQGGGHLGPLERPAELVDRIGAFVQSVVVLPPNASHPLAADFQALIDSNLTSPQTRTVLNSRLADDQADGTDGPLAFREILVLKAMARRILPGCAFDLASRVQVWLALPAHDGWRHDSLPPDTEAWKIGLASIDSAALREHSVPFFALDFARQDDLLTKALQGKLSSGLLHTLHLDHGHEIFTAPQMADWFGDLCGELTKLYIADPRTMGRIGFTGFADEAGFTQIRLNEREDFER